jgi:hypothetical protein
MRLAQGTFPQAAARGRRAIDKIDFLSCFRNLSAFIRADRGKTLIFPVLPRAEAAKLGVPCPFL